MSDQQTVSGAVEQRLGRALDRLQKLASFGAPFGARIEAEREYGAAYQELVKAGVKPQIRGKYREQR